MSKIILLNKPFHVLSQFSDREPRDGGPRATLADFLQAPQFRVAGRLDYDSEGLLLLTDDGVLQQQIANPRHRQWKTYLVQVEGEISAQALQRLSEGLQLRDGPTLPARARRIPEPDLWPRVPPVRVRKTVPDSWLELRIREGRNRQVRRMTAAVGLPTLRLVRTRIGDWSLGELQPGEHLEMTVETPAASARRRGVQARRR